MYGIAQLFRQETPFIKLLELSSIFAPTIFPLGSIISYVSVIL